MTKTPEQMAEEYANWLTDKAQTIRDVADSERPALQVGFLAGYQAAKDEYKVAIDTYNDVAKQMLEEAVRIMSPKDQLADADKVIPQWISVKDRLPNLEKTSRSLRRESSCILLVSYGNVYVAHLCEDWTDRSHFIFEACTCNCRAFDMDIDEWKLDQVTHWMPLPKPPEDE